MRVITQVHIEAAQKMLDGFCDYVPVTQELDLGHGFMIHNVDGEAWVVYSSDQSCDMDQWTKIERIL